MNGISLFIWMLAVTLLPALSLAAPGSAAYTIQVGAFADKNNADTLVANLKHNSFGASWFRNGNGLYIVQSGRYATREKAGADASRLASGGLIGTYVIVPLKGGVSDRASRKKALNDAPRISASKLAETVKKHTATIQTPHAAVASVSRGSEPVVRNPQHTAGQAQADVVAGNSESRIALATSRPREIIRQREHGARVYPALEAGTAPKPSSLPAPGTVQLPPSPAPDGSRVAKHAATGKLASPSSSGQDAFTRDSARLQERISVSETMAFVKEHEAALKQCRRPEVFNSLAEYLAKNARQGEAASIYRSLLSCDRDEGLQLGIFYALKPLLPHEQLLSLADRKLENRAISAKHRASLETFKVEMLHGLLATEPERVETNARAILKIRPADRIALSALGWRHFSRQEYEEAYDCFRQLDGSEARRTEYLEGMIYSLMGLEKLDQALDVALLNRNDQKIAAMVDEIRLKMLWNKVASLPPDAPEIEELAENILQIRPENEDIRVVRAWHYFNAQEFEKARQEFNTLYLRNKSEKGYAYGLASTLAKLGRYDEAAAVAAAGKQGDERLAVLENSIYLERAGSAYKREDYREAELYFGKVVAADPDDQESRELLESSKYRQTFVARLLSPIVGLPGHTWGSLSHDLKGRYGSGASVLLNQGIDWVRLPWDVTLRTYGEAWYRTRSEDARYYDIAGLAAGAELRKSAFSLGAEYASERYTRQSKKNRGGVLFLSWYQDWYKYLYDNSDDAGWFNLHSLSGSTYGKVFHDLGGNTGTGITGNINQGIDWLRLPGDMILNSFLEYRFSFRTGDNRYYNEHGPAVGTELQRSPFRLGIEYYWEHDTERHRQDQRAIVYLKWYYGWDLKSGK